MAKKSQTEPEGSQHAKTFAALAKALGSFAFVLCVASAGFSYAVAHGADAYVCLFSEVFVVGAYIFAARQ